MKSNTGLVESQSLKEKFTFNPKEGIDNPVMVITDDADSASPRLCVLKKEEWETFGFFLRLERVCQGHIIRNVALGGVADRSGLKDGDRVLEVNNCYVDDVPHAEVTKRIKLSGHHMCLLVLDGDAYERAASQELDLKDLTRSLKAKGCKPPRLCHITRDPVSGLGVCFTPVEGEKGCFSVSLVAGGAAERAGVRKGDRLVWMNGATVSDVTHIALTRMMKKCGNHITILVVDSESESVYTRQRMPVLPAMAVPHNLPYRARKLRLASAPGGYGFLLRLEKGFSGRKVHVLREVDGGSPAERAGVRDGDVLLEVNEESTSSMTHEQMVDKVKESKEELLITTITPQGLEFYTQLGLSPLLFCEDGAAESPEESPKLSPKLTPKLTPAPAQPPLQQQMEGSCRSRFCSLQKGPLGFGFNLGNVQNKPGTFISLVAFGGPGSKAGLLVGDVLVEVNGQKVDDKNLEDVIMLIKEGGNFLSLLVMDKKSYKKLKGVDSEESEEDEITYL